MKEDRWCPLKHGQCSDQENALEDCESCWHHKFHVHQVYGEQPDDLTKREQRILDIIDSSEEYYVE